MTFTPHMSAVLADLRGSADLQDCDGGGAHLRRHRPARPQLRLQQEPGAVSLRIRHGPARVRRFAFVVQ